MPPAISFYALWLHFRFWNMSPKLYFTIENRLPATFGAGLGKEARIGVFMYYLAVLFANKHLDDFSYRNSSWCVSCRLLAALYYTYILTKLTGTRLQGCPRPTSSNLSWLLSGNLSGLWRSPATSGSTGLTTSNLPTPNSSPPRLSTSRITWPSATRSTRPSLQCVSCAHLALPIVGPVLAALPMPLRPVLALNFLPIPRRSRSSTHIASRPSSQLLSSISPGIRRRTPLWKCAHIVAAAALHPSLRRVAVLETWQEAPTEFGASAVHPSMAVWLGWAKEPSIWTLNIVALPPRVVSLDLV